MTERRTFIGAVALCVLTAPLGAQVQRAQKMYRIGWLAGTAPPDEHWKVFIEGMRERGWIEGQNFTFERLYSDSQSERFPALAAELVRRKVDIIVTAGTPPTTAARDATTTIPIVFFYAGDPVGSGFAASLARPGGNITGLGGLAPGVSAKTLELLKEAVPKASRIAILVNSSLAVQAASLAEIEAAARRIGVSLSPVEIRAPDELDTAFAAIARERPDALLILGQPFMFPHRARLAALALEQRLPAIISFKEVAEAGLLMSYGALLLDDLRRLPYYIDRILKGAPSGDLPIEQPSRFYLIVNLKTARAIGIAIPQSLLLRADEVFD